MQFADYMRRVEAASLRLECARAAFQEASDELDGLLDEISVEDDPRVALNVLTVFRTALDRSRRGLASVPCAGHA